MGGDVHIGRAVRLQQVRGITLGSRVFIHRHTRLDLRGGITIGDDVVISPEARIMTADHDPNSPTREYRRRGVTVASRSWLGTNATLLPGTAVAEGCVVGSGAVAHGTLDPFGLYVGSPARRVRDRAPDAQQRVAGSMARWQ